jgi:hypothetical protein
MSARLILAACYRNGRKHFPSFIGRLSLLLLTGTTVLVLTTTGVADPVDLGDPAHIADVAVGMRPQGLTVTPEIPVGQRPVQLVFISMVNAFMC